MVASSGSSLYKRASPNSEYYPHKVARTLKPRFFTKKYLVTLEIQEDVVNMAFEPTGLSSW
jgi:hypothetical protein